MNEETLKLVTNRELIAIDQDEEARPPMWGHHPWSDKLLVLVKHLANGKYALGFFNMDEKDAEIPAILADYGLPASAGYDVRLHDVFGKEEDKTWREYVRVNVPAHDCRVYTMELVQR